MIKKIMYKVNPDDNYLFRNHADYCIGTGRMGLALQKEYHEQLALVQKEIGFQYIRGHGLFAKDMAIFQVYEDDNGDRKVEYNFTYLDLVMDNYLSLGIRPFLELGFMPDKLASGEQTVFYWEGNVTPPQSYDEWCALVQSTLQHLIERYGTEEVLKWPIEVWNEPNLPGFWKDADMKEYFKLFQKTFMAIKEVNQKFRVGGPAICGVEDELWIREFMKFCHEQSIPVDFVTRHHYTSQVPETVGHYGYIELQEIEEGLGYLHTTRELVDQYEEYRDMEIHITEFNTSYIPNCPLHDTNQNAAYIAHLLSRLGDDNESYSYWTFGDIFEEFGVPFSPFYGGFGLVANGCIPKPTFWTFKFFKDLQGKCVQKTDNLIIMKKENGCYSGIIWNDCVTRTEVDLEVDLEIALDTTECKMKNTSEYLLTEKIVNEKTCNPLRHWHNMGEPQSLTTSQKIFLQDCAKPELNTEIIQSENDMIRLHFTVKENGVSYFDLEPRMQYGDRGFDYNRVMQNNSK